MRRWRLKEVRKAKGFTLIEVMLAVSLMAVMTFVAFFTFNTAINSWKRSTEMADRMQHADYALSQVVSALRSAWCPATATTGGGADSYLYGFQLIDGGDGEEDSDIIQWTKLGSAIVGNTSTLSETPHTVRLWAQTETRDQPGGLWVKAGQLDLIQDEDKEDYNFDDDDVFEPYVLVTGVQGFNCRVLNKEQPYEEDGTPVWEDEWISSNNIPRAVELTFTLEPVEERGDPVRIRRVVEIPLWDLSQNPLTSSGNGKDGETGGRGRRTGGTGTTGGGKTSGGTSTGGAGRSGGQSGGNSPAPPPPGGAP